MRGILPRLAALIIPGLVGVGLCLFGTSPELRLSGSGMGAIFFAAALLLIFTYEPENPE